MSESRKTHVKPPTKLSGSGRSGPLAKNEPSSSAKSDPLTALDGIMTASLQQSGRLPTPKFPDVPSATTPPPNIGDFDPMQMPVWTLLMALAWIATRDLTTVTWQRNDWRRANGLPDGSIPIASIGATEGVSELLGEDEDNADDPTAFRALGAFAQLRSAGESGAIEVHAMSAGQGRPMAMGPLDWTYGKLSFDHRYEEVWRVGGDRFHTLTVQRDALMKAFPAQTKGTGLTGNNAAPASDAVDLSAFAATLPNKQAVVAKAIVWKWPEGLPDFPTNGARDEAVFEAMKQLNPALRPTDRPSRDTIHRAIRALRQIGLR